MHWLEFATSMINFGRKKDVEVPQDTVSSLIGSESVKKTCKKNALCDEFLLQKKWTQVEQKNFGLLDLKFDRNKKRQGTDYSGKKPFLREYLVLSDYF